MAADVLDGKVIRDNRSPGVQAESNHRDVRLRKHPEISGSFRGHADAGNGSGVCFADDKSSALHHLKPHL